MRVIVTGGCGFIGSSFIHLLERLGIDYLIVDKLTYAADIDNIPDKKKLLVKDICEVTESDLGEYDYLVNFAAESHVDNSISDGKPFVNTNVMGTFNLLEVARKNSKLKKFIQISTDEVYGDMTEHFAMNHYLSAQLCVLSHCGLLALEKLTRQVEGMKGNHLDQREVVIVKKESGAHQSKSILLHAMDLRYFPLHCLL